MDVKQRGRRYQKTTKTLRFLIFSAGTSAFFYVSGRKTGEFFFDGHENLSVLFGGRRKTAGGILDYDVKQVGNSRLRRKTGGEILDYDVKQMGVLRLRRKTGGILDYDVKQVVKFSITT